VDSMLPSEIKDMVLSQVAREIRMASEGRGQEFIPGRQTVDLIFIVTQKSTANHYLLIGKRNGEKIDFPGCWGIPGGKILEFESPVDAAVRCFEMEAGIDIRVADNSCEPALVTVESLDGMESLLHFSGIYASEDERINGTRGGGSQCFAVCVEGDVSEISRLLHSRHDMDELKFIDVDSIHSIELAYDQKRMVLDALNKLGIAYDNGEMLCTLDENGVALREGVSRSRAHSEGILHGAAHTYIYKWEEEELYILLQRRSLNKDSFPGCLDSSSAGHIELGSDFLQTAKKELFEELGLEAGEELFRELFEQRIHSENVFHGRAFIDNEINKVYAIEMPVDISTLAFQPSEVSEVVWLSADRILAMLTSGDGELCMDDAEIKRVIEILKEKK